MVGTLWLFPNEMTTLVLADTAREISIKQSNAQYRSEILTIYLTVTQLIFPSSNLHTKNIEPSR